MNTSGLSKSRLDRMHHVLSGYIERPTGCATREIPEKLSSYYLAKHDTLCYALSRLQYKRVNG